MLRMIETGGEMEIYLDGKLVGRAVGDVYITKRRKEHYFRKFNGFGISKRILDELNSRGIYRIIIIYKNEDSSEILLKSDVMQWLFNGIEWVDTSEGYEDLQLVLPVIEMEIEGGTPDFWGR